MHNHDAVIYFGALFILLFAWITAFIVHHRLEVAHDKKLAHEHDLAMMRTYFQGWDDGAETALEMVNSVVEKDRFAFVTWNPNK